MPHFSARWGLPLLLAGLGALQLQLALAQQSEPPRPQDTPSSGAGHSVQPRPPKPPAPKPPGDTFQITAVQLRIEPGRLTYDGAVEIKHDGYVINADRAVYDRAKRDMELTGKVRMTMPSGAIVTAKRTILDPRLRDGFERDVLPSIPSDNQAPRK